MYRLNSFLNGSIGQTPALQIMTSFCQALHVPWKLLTEPERAWKGAIFLSSLPAVSLRFACPRWRTDCRSVSQRCLFFFSKKEKFYVSMDQNDPDDDSSKSSDDDASPDNSDVGEEGQIVRLFVVVVQFSFSKLR